MESQLVGMKQEPVKKKKVRESAEGKPEKKVKKPAAKRGQWNNNFNQTIPSECPDKWVKINEMLFKLEYQAIEITVNGPLEESVIFALYNLTREVQGLRKKLEDGDFLQVQKLERLLEGE